MTKRRWTKGALSLVSVLFALVLVEGGLRLFLGNLEPWAAPNDGRRTCAPNIVVVDARTGWWGKPGLDCQVVVDGRVIHVRTNSLGMRAEREYGRKPPGVIRIGVFGDSFTFAEQVQGHETYAAIVEQRVANIEVLNFGLNAGSLDQSLLALKDKAAGFELDAVVVAPLVENITRLPLAERFGIAKPYFTVADGRLQAHNYPLAKAPAALPDSGEDGGPRSAVWWVAATALRPPMLMLGLYRPFRSYYEGPSGELLERILIGFRDQAPDAALVFAPLPTFHYIEYDLPRDYEPVFRRAAEATGGIFVDVLSAFERLGPAQRRATRFQYDQHYTALGHRVVAEALEPYLRAVREQRLARTDTR